MLEFVNSSKIRYFQTILSFLHIVSHITDNRIVFADITMPDIHLKGNYMSILCYFFDSQGNQSENLNKKNLGKIS